MLENPWLAVRCERVRTGRGVELPEYYLIDAPDIVVVLALTEAREALLVWQYRHGAGRTVLELPAGLLDLGDDSPELAAARELREETGYAAGSLELLGRTSPSPARQSNSTHCFLALDCRQVSTPGGDPAEEIVVERLTLPDLRAAARRGDLPSQTSLGCLFLGLERLRELGLL